MDHRPVHRGVVAAVAAAVIVSLRGSVAVPDVAGKTQTDAGQTLEAAGLNVGAIAKASDPTAPAGTVIRQDPAAGTKVDKDSAVALTLSSGPGAAEVPDVIGMDRAEAESALARGRLRADERDAVRPHRPGGRSRRPAPRRRRAGGGRFAGRPPGVQGPAGSLGERARRDRDDAGRSDDGARRRRARRRAGRGLRRRRAQG